MIQQQTAELEMKMAKVSLTLCQGVR